MTYLTDLATALAALGERDLLGLRAAIDGSPNFVPGLLAWLEHAIGWEIDRRAGLVYPQLDAHAAIPDGEIDRSVVALAVLAACFRDDGRTDSVPVADFPEFTAEVLRTEFRITTLCTSITPKNVRMRVRHIAERRRPCSG